jgi:hypothetical protein
MKRTIIGLVTISVIFLGLNMIACSDRTAAPDGEPDPCADGACPEQIDFDPGTLLGDQPEIGTPGDIDNDLPTPDDEESSDPTVIDGPIPDLNSGPYSVIATGGYQGVILNIGSTVTTTSTFEEPPSLIDTICPSDDNWLCKPAFYSFFNNSCIDLRDSFEYQCIRNIVDERSGDTEGEKFKLYEATPNEQYLYRDGGHVSEDALESGSQSILTFNEIVDVIDAYLGYDLNNYSGYKCEIAYELTDCIVVSEGKKNAVAICLELGSTTDNFDYQGCIDSADETYQ